MKKFRYLFEYILIRALTALWGMLPLDIASNLGGVCGRLIGPATGMHRKARAQIGLVFPDWPKEKINTTLMGMWDNLGRVMAEYPHLKTIMATRITFDNQSGLPMDSLAARPVLFIGGHFANWEVSGPALFQATKDRLHLVYRAANNRRVDRLLWRFRSLNGLLPTIAKSGQAGLTIYRALADGHKVGILIDQKFTGGVVVPFLGLPAMTSPLFVHMGRRLGMPIIPAQVIRTDGAHFTIRLYPPLALITLDGAARPDRDIVADAHDLMFAWVRENPAQWLWVHRRWSSPGLTDVAIK